MSERVDFTDDGSGVLKMNEYTTALVLLKDMAAVLRLPLALNPSELTVVWPRPASDERIAVQVRSGPELRALTPRPRDAGRQTCAEISEFRLASARRLIVTA